MAKGKDIELDEDVLTVKEIITLEDGKHSGEISDVVKEKREDKKSKAMYDYVDIVIALEKEDLEEIKVGYPASISNLSGLGQTLKKAGMEFKAGDTITMGKIKKLLVGKKVEFLTYKNEQGFSQVVPETLKFVD